jgi:predicted dehydrogenase
VYDSTDSLLESGGVDAIVVATPHHLLASSALKAIRAGKHVLVEKPMAMSEQEARSVEFAAASAGVCCMVGYSFRFLFGKYLHELIAANAVGDIQGVIGSIGTGPMNTGWIAKPESGGGPLFYVGCHAVDLLLWLTGDDARSVLADIRYREDTGADERSAISIHLAQGAVAQLYVSQSAPGFFFDLHIYGRSGRIGLRARNFLQFEIDVLSTTVAAYREPTLIRPTPQRDHVSMMLVPEFEEFARAINGDRAPSITPSDGRRVLRILDAVAESARTGQRIQLDTPVLAAY